MGSKKHEIDWETIWRQVAETMARHGATSDVIESISCVEWKVNEGKFFLFCPKELYNWIEVPSPSNTESNLRYIKPFLWPAMQRLGCRTLIYKLT